MFDANARYLPDGKLFFAECRSLDPESYLLNKVLKVGKNYLCEKIGDHPYKCKFRIFLNSTKKDYITVGVDFEDEEGFDDYDHVTCLDVCLGTFWEGHLERDIKRYLAYVNKYNEESLESWKEELKLVQGGLDGCIYVKKKLTEVLGV